MPQAIPYRLAAPKGWPEVAIGTGLNLPRYPADAMVTGG